MAKKGVAKKAVPIWAFALVAVLCILTYALGCYNAGLIDPERGLPDTLTELSNQALRNHGRSVRVSRTEGVSCQISESLHHDIGWDRVHYCTAKAIFSDGHTSEICIYRMFRGHSKGPDDLEMTVNLCGEDSDIEATESFDYYDMFYDFDRDLTAEDSESGAE